MTGKPKRGECFHPMKKIRDGICFFWGRWRPVCAECGAVGLFVSNPKKHFVALSGGKE